MLGPRAALCCTANLAEDAEGSVAMKSPAYKRFDMEGACCRRGT